MQIAEAHIQGGQSTGEQLYEFLYIDTGRVNALMAQLRSAEITGVPAGWLKQTEGETAKHNKQQDAVTQLNHATDWELLLELIRKLTASERLHRQIQHSSLGDLLLLNGELRVFDARMVHSFIPVYKALKLTENLGAKSNKEKLALREELKELEQVEEVSKFLSVSTQIDFQEESGASVWMSVASANLTVNVADLALKYGALIAGKWRIVGFVDALPDPHSTGKDNADRNVLVNKQGMANMLMKIRKLMGRPTHCWGVTPLIIYRQIN